MSEQQVRRTCLLGLLRPKRGDISPHCQYQPVLEGKQRCFHYRPPEGLGGRNINIVPDDCPVLLKLQCETWRRN